jgi:hypothetical protein
VGPNYRRLFPPGPAPQGVPGKDLAAVVLVVRDVISPCWHPRKLRLTHDLYIITV